MRQNLLDMHKLADKTDIAEGLIAYERYHFVMRQISDRFACELGRVIAAFVSLSPNNDYVSNLRSLITLMVGIEKQLPLEAIKCSTYRHCLARAYQYATGADDFLSKTKGLKVKSFYHNILNPKDHRWVTVDGHICAIWRGQDLTMQEALIKSAGEYRIIADTLKQIAFSEFLLPNQFQAILWFTRKRILDIRAEHQHDLFYLGDTWKIMRPLTELKPYGM